MSSTPWRDIRLIEVSGQGKREHGKLESSHSWSLKLSLHDVAHREPSTSRYCDAYVLNMQAVNHNMGPLSLRSQNVLPSLMDKNGAPLLTELLHMWAKYKVMVKCLGGFFLYLDRHFADGKSAAPLRDVSVVCFHDLVFVKFYDKCRDAAIDLISQDRAEEMIDRGLLKNISSFFMEIGGQGNTSYYESFEKAIIADVSIYYSSLASEWLFRYSCTDYIRKAEWCLNQENARASQYLYQTSVEKLLQVLSSSLVLHHWPCNFALLTINTLNC
ncbi:hypothetical protein RJ639_008616 [Escallonia herrerae]|uniref:Cullin N-terminal domain-containing protein n=1 Tax=Escallonia herrerae TaxID=1293975 RepID=A0AA88VPT2_9ASTE|nr:hypothetical protein RJ639_008616 [Escallonia herrerae]